MKKPVNITYRKGLNAGASSAEQDDKFLKECFVDNGSVDIVSDIDRNESIVLGRVGSGKSAILWHINENRQSIIIELPPEIRTLT